MEAGTPQQKVEQYIAGNKVMVFSKSYCPFCDQTKDKLKGAGIEFHAIEMDNMPDGDAIHQALKKHSNQNTVPNTYIGGVHIGGNDDLTAKIANGQVKTALDNAGVTGYSLWRSTFIWI